MTRPFAPPAVIVGIDGSRSATRAALWAIDDAVSRDIPLRLIYVVAPEQPMQGAERAIRDVVDAVESTHRHVKLETEILCGPPAKTLLESATGAAMICIGAVGPTARSLVAGAHCPIAIVRAPDRPRNDDHRWIVVRLDQSPSSATVLACGVHEARLRGAPLRVISSADYNPLVSTHLDPRVEQWKQRYPDLDVRPVSVHCSALDFLAMNAQTIRLVVVGADDTASVCELLAPTGSTILPNTGYSVLVTDHQRLL